ncbi:MAG: GTPase domain-containing protein [Thermogutta sp.]
MTSQFRSHRDQKTIKVGIYGKTWAGKTRFLYQLINYWEKTGRIIRKSQGCQKFLDTVANSIKSSGGPGRTTEKQDITALVRHIKRKESVKFHFLDLGGEFLAKDLDGLASHAGDNDKNHIQRQVRECNAYIFFFDPSSSEVPADIDEHYRNELRRAEKFIEYVVHTRENEVLPVVFVLTHLDVWENNEDIRKRVDEWCSKVHDELSRAYAQKLKNLHPKSVVSRDRIFFFVSSIGTTQEDDKRLDHVAMELVDLVADSERNLQQLRPSWSKVRVVLVVLVAFVLVLVVAVSLQPRTSPPVGSPSPTQIAKPPKMDIRSKLDEVEMLLTGWQQQGTRIPTTDEAKKVNDFLRVVQGWMTTNPPDKQSVTEETQQRLKESLKSIAKVVSKVRERMVEKAGDATIPLDEGVSLLETFLENLPDLTPFSEELAQCQKGYWQTKRLQVADRIARIMKRRDELKSPCMDALSEVKAELETAKQEVKNSLVYGAQDRQILLEAIDATVTFCEDRINNESYQAEFRVVSAKAISDKRTGLVWHTLRLLSGKTHTGYFGLEPVRESERTVSYKTAKDSYEIALGLDRRVICEISAYDNEKKQWQKPQEFDLTSDPGPLAALGMPLVNRDRVTKAIRHQDFELTIEFFEFSPVPELIWEAVGRASVNSESGAP